MVFRGRSSEGQDGRGRGGGEGRGRGRGGRWSGRGRGVWTPSQIPNSRASEPFGPIIDTINIKTLFVDEETPTIENANYVASYNWSKEKPATILVPGSPPAWTPPAIDPQLRPDDHSVFRDLNAAKWPKHPLEPAVRSLQTMCPDFEFPSVDILACGHTMGYLLKAARSDPVPFRFDVDMIGETIFFVRKGGSPTELITDLHGYGFRFPKMYTTWDTEVQNTLSHQRIIHYAFSGLQILLRSGTDGYLQHDGALLSASPDLDTSLEDAVSTLSVGAANPPEEHDELKLKMKGSLVPQSKIFDIKTRAQHNPINMDAILPGLWLNQTPNFLIAYHEYGLFNSPQIQCVRQDVLAWEGDNSTMLATFHAILKRIIDVVSDAEKHQCEVSWDGAGELLITEQIGDIRRALPSDLRRHFITL